MLTAIRKYDNLKVIGSEITKDLNQVYYCDFCNNDVIHHRSESKIKIGHFKHKAGDSHCPNSKGESEIHLQTKLEIYNYIRLNWGKALNIIEVEKWLFGKTIRSDIYIETKRGLKIAIEVQASSLNVSEIKRRTENYTKNNIYTLWILPYDLNRFYGWRSEVGYNEDGSYGKVKDVYGLAQNIRFKEYELFLYRCYFKRLYFWDLSHQTTNDFISIRFEDCHAEQTTYFKEGEERMGGGAKKKTIKSAEGINVALRFNDFQKYDAKEFKESYREYTIPPRKIMVRKIK